MYVCAQVEQTISFSRPSLASHAIADSSQAVGVPTHWDRMYSVLRTCIRTWRRVTGRRPSSKLAR